MNSPENEKETKQQQRNKMTKSRSVPAKNATMVRYILVIAVLAVVLAIVAFLEFGINGKRIDSLQSESSSEAQTIQQAVSEQQQALSTIQTRLAQMRHVQQRVLLQLANNSAGLERLMRVSFSSHEQWTLDEAVHLVRLANYYLQFNHNVQAATALLKAADQRISRLGEPSLLSTRQMLADKITELSAIPTVDMAGLMVRINALSQAVEKLPLPQAKFGDSLPKQSDTKTPSKWRKAVSDGWQQLQKVVIIRHRDAGVKPLLAPGQQTAVVQNIQLLLQQAQWAALQEKPIVYKLSLEQAGKMISDYFDTKAAPSQSALAELKQLQAMSIKPKVPDLSSVIVALQKQQKSVKPEQQEKTSTKPSDTNQE